MIHSQAPLVPPILKKMPNEKTWKKILEFGHKCEDYSSHYYHILYGLMSEINEIKKLSDDDIDDNTEAFIYILKMFSVLDNQSLDINNKKFSCDELIKILNEYIKFLKSNTHSLNILIIRQNIKYNKKFNIRKESYSFYRGTKMFLDGDNVPPVEDCLISMLYARDFYNIDSIKILRSFIMTSNIGRGNLETDRLDKNPDSNLWSLFMSDCVLIDRIIKMYFGLRLDKDKYYLFNIDSLEKDGELDATKIHFVCIAIYARFILAIFIFIIEGDLSFGDKEIFLHQLMKIYRGFSLFIFAHIYKYLSITEILLFSNVELLNDVCAHFSDIYSIQRISEIRSLSSALAADSMYQNLTKVINKIVEKSLSMLKDGSDFDHIDFIEYFEKSKKYGKYFDESGFRRNLSEALKKMMRDNKINRIRGDGYYPKGIKRPHKKKESS